MESEVIWTDEYVPGYMDDDGSSYLREWPPYSDQYVKLIQGEVVETVESTPLLERGEIPLSTAESSNSGTEHAAGTGPAGNRGLPLPLLRRLASHKTGAKRWKRLFPLSELDGRRSL